MRCFRFKTQTNSNCSKKITVISGKLIFFAQFLFVLLFFCFLSLITLFWYVLKKKRNIVYILWKKYTKTTCFYRIYKVDHSFRKENREKLLFFSNLQLLSIFQEKIDKTMLATLAIKHCAPTFAQARLRIHFCQFNICACASFANP